MGKSTDLSTLGDRLKQYEETYETRLPDEGYIVIRLDGHGFSKYTKGLDKPFDAKFSIAMQKVSETLLSEFQAICSYTQSDEITLILPPRVVKGESHQIYGGRVQKLVSLTAGLASTVFSSHFTNPASKKLPYFDSRVYSVASVEEAYNSIMWRCRDAEKNSKNVFAQSYCSHRSLLNKTSQEQIELCNTATGKDWNTIDTRYKFGLTSYKKLVYVKADSTNPRAQPAYRNIIASEGIDITSFDEVLLEKLLLKGK